MELMGISPQFGKILREIEPDLDAVGPQLVSEEISRIADHRVEVHRRSIRRVLASEPQEIPHDANAPVGGFHDLLGALGHCRRGPHHAQELRLTGDHGERVVELMRDARQELSHGRQLLHLHELPRALVDALLEDPFFILQLPVKEARVKQVPDAKKEFPQLEGLRQEVVRSGLQRPSKGLARHIGREDEHGHEAVFRGHPVEVSQDLEARPVRHA